MTDSPLVLIVEDSPTQAKKIAANLVKHGFRIVIAEDGVAGLQAVDEHQPQLIVLDVNLPRMDGYQVCYRLKRDPNTAHIPIIMLTVADSSEATLKGLEAGADDYIPKDVFAEENLVSTLRALNVVVDESD
jgi:DNA-binding response OmpR family regulator